MQQTWMVWLGLIGGALLLWRGADGLVDAATRIARRRKIPELVVGLTLVGFGTSAPELAVSVGSALSGHSGIALSNVVGSNTFNLGFILGGCALLRPLSCGATLLYRDLGVLIAATCAFGLFSLDGALSRLEGFALLLGLCGYLAWLFLRSNTSKKSTNSESQQEEEYVDTSSTWRDMALGSLGLGAVLLGAHFLVHGASTLAQQAGWSQWTIGATVVAAGTSMPEMVTAWMAALKGRSDISIGALVGSDIYNVLGVLGVAALAHPIGVDGQALRGMGLMLASLVAIFVFLRLRWGLNRWQGGIWIVLTAFRWFWDVMQSGHSL